jgi:hypothetical protein
MSVYVYGRRTKYEKEEGEESETDEDDPRQSNAQDADEEKYEYCVDFLNARGEASVELVEQDKEVEQIELVEQGKEVEQVELVEQGKEVEQVELVEEVEQAVTETLQKLVESVEKEVADRTDSEQRTVEELLSGDLTYQDQVRAAFRALSTMSEIHNDTLAKLDETKGIQFAFDTLNNNYKALQTENDELRSELTQVKRKIEDVENDNDSIQRLCNIFERDAKKAQCKKCKEVCTQCAVCRA